MRFLSPCRTGRQRPAAHGLRPSGQAWAPAPACSRAASATEQPGQLQAAGRPGSGARRGQRPDAGAEHGLHIHDKGDCSAPDAMSAGGHFNPGKAPWAAERRSPWR